MNPKRTALMLKTIALAKKGWPRAKPNPLVGCIIVKNGQTVGKGYHSYFGGPHAEIEALKQAGTKTKGATLYVNLEPCSHWGKTPPCVDSIINSGIQRVVASMRDPNPLVSGQGFAKLKKAGIQVSIGLGAQEATALNLPFLTWVSKKRPYVILKAAMTLDGKIADYQGNAKWITGPALREKTQAMRQYCDAIIVGVNTIIKDNPALTTHGQGKNPTRVILDPNLRIPKNAQILKDNQAKTIIVTRQHILALLRAQAKQSHRESLMRLPRPLGPRNDNLEILEVPYKNGCFDLKALLMELAKRNIQSLLVEGGGETHAHFVEKQLFDELFWLIAPKLLGGQSAPTAISGKGLALNHATHLKAVTYSTTDNTLIARATANSNSHSWSLLQMFSSAT